MKARLVTTPDELAQFLAPLSAAGADMFHCSTLKFWEPEFEGSNLNLAGWTRKLTGKPAISGGSVNCNTAFRDSDRPPNDVNGVMDNAGDAAARIAGEEFDLIAVGRALIANPAWPDITRRGAYHELVPFDNDDCNARLY